MDTTNMDIKLEFKHPNSVSKDSKNPQYVTIKAKFSDFEPGWIDDLFLANIAIPAQKTESQAAAAEQAASAQAAASSAKSATLFVMIFHIATSGAMAKIWSMINGC